ncbi:uncharacterized protein LOC112571113 [Pomacea canaliculata]|uniref:uncharacterized protein LOC112571113 n=1 Tax=Pomacea canaliculata TaxID=400727 RepID=UPI000D73475F|nr:uncharacterized protein LOC112571113 [Pomacea canaliculata]
MSFNKSSLTEDMNVSATQDSYHKVNTWNIHEDFLSLQTTRNIEEITSCGFHNLNFLIGSPANILNMIVFYRQGLRDRMNLCLFCLAFTDLMYLMTIFIIDAYCFIGIPFPDQKEMWKWTPNIILALVRFAVPEFHVDGRYGNLFMTTHYIANLPVMFNTSINFFVSYVKGQAVLMRMLVEVCCIYILCTTPNIILALARFAVFEFRAEGRYTLTLIGLRNAMAWRTSSASSYVKGQAVLMRMLVVVSSLYILCTAPNIILALSRFIEPEFRAGGRYSNFFMATHAISQLPVMFNSSVNFFVFAKMSSRFQYVLKTLCLCMRTSVSSRSSLGTINHSKEKH